MATRERLSLWADLFQLGQGVALILGSIVGAAAYLAQLPWPLIVFAALAAAGVGIIVTYAILSLRRSRPLSADIATRVAPSLALSPPEFADSQSKKPADINEHSSAVVLRRHNGEPSEREIRWPHLEAVNLNDTLAQEATLSIIVRGHRVDPIAWKWAGRLDKVNIRKTPVLIPLVIGAVEDRAGQPIATGWVIPKGKWFLTPDGNGRLGPEVVFDKTTRLLFEVVVSWIENLREYERRDCFEVRLWSDPERVMFGADLTHVDCEDNDFVRFTPAFQA